MAAEDWTSDDTGTSLLRKLVSNTYAASSGGGGSGDLLAANNLSDLASAATARTNLGLTALATTTPGTGIATALAVNVGSAGAPVLFNGAGGTPTSLTLTNATGLPAASVLAGSLGAGAFTMTETVGSSALTLTGATQTSNFPVLNMTQTWNNAGMSFQGIKLNVTSTASAAASLLMDLQVASASVFKVDKAGKITFTNQSHAIDTNGTYMRFYAAGAESLALGASDWRISASTLIIGDIYGTNGAQLVKEASHILGLRNSTNAQTLRVYNTYTSSTSHERGSLEWASNVWRIGSQKGSGGGTARAIALITDDTNRINIGAAGELGFFGATAIAKPTVSGSRALPEQALSDLITELANLGLITDSTSV